ncbi:MAG: NosL [Syntrophorhabdus sp. PtaU1.Bin153]|nr:MAG: NosL [Syntrophorhabdus sp. PtaU1.Bin153]
MRYRKTGIIILVIPVLILIPYVTPLLSGEMKSLAPSPKDKCPVCGMFVAKYPDFLARIIFKDDTTVFFDGAKDMFKFYFNLLRYSPKKKVEDIVSIYVTDYYSLSPADGAKAYYVIGSDVYGPMGRELIPFAKIEEAKEFLKDHKGKEILNFQDITFSVVKGLD